MDKTFNLIKIGIREKIINIFLILPHKYTTYLSLLQNCNVRPHGEFTPRTKKSLVSHEGKRIKVNKIKTEFTNSVMISYIQFIRAILKDHIVILISTSVMILVIIHRPNNRYFLILVMRR